jgi:hypothetical protein
MAASTLPNGERRPLNVAHEAYALDVFAKLTGGGVGTDLVNADSSNRGSGEIVSAVWSSTGTYTVTFRHAYPALLWAPQCSFVGSNLDFNMITSAIDVSASSATFVFGVGTTPTDVATTTTVYVRWTVLTVNKR